MPLNVWVTLGKRAWYMYVCDMYRWCEKKKRERMRGQTREKEKKDRETRWVSSWECVDVNVGEVVGAVVAFCVWFCVCEGQSARVHGRMKENAYEKARAVESWSECEFLCVYMCICVCIETYVFASPKCSVCTNLKPCSFLKIVLTYLSK